MREILFRGKSIDDGKWKYSMSLARHATEDGIITSYYIGSGYDIVKAETVGQYTGLTDKNATKIFEGDILKQYGFCYVVSFENGSYVAYETPYNESAILPRMDWENAVVIGNIHDNPELLKGGVQK